jgi:hypothetical protein
VGSVPLSCELTVPLPTDEAPSRVAGVVRRMLPRVLPRSQGLARACLLTTAKARHAGPSHAAEEDSNLHPVGLNQALNLGTESEPG